MANLQLGDLVRYKDGGRPDAKVARVERSEVHLEYLQPWEHPGLGGRTVLAQTLGTDERAEWRKVPA